MPTKGYHTITPIYIPLTGPIAVSRLPREPTAYTRANASVQVVDIDPQSAEYGRRFPLSVTQTTTADSYRPENLLQVLPTLGITLRPDTTYAALVTDKAPVELGYRLLQNPQLQSVLSSPQSANSDVPEKANELFAPLRQYLDQQQTNPDSIIAATVWRTGDPTAALRRGAAAVAKMPLAGITRLELAKDFPDYCVIRGYVNTPEPGYPLLEFHHGAGGSAEQVFNRGKYTDNGTKEPGNGPSQIAAERGWASSGFAGHLGVDADGPIIRVWPGPL